MGKGNKMANFPIEETESISLCEALDRVLNKGAVVMGEMTISVANIDLIYLGLQLVLTSVDTMRQERNVPYNIPVFQKESG
jgi:hypothetical protein